MEIILQVFQFLTRNVLFWNLLFAVIIVFFERREPRSVWGWLLLLFFLPGAGFVCYLFLGVDMHKRKMFRVKELEEHLDEAVKRQTFQLRLRERQEADSDIQNYTDLIMYNLKTADAVLFEENDIDVFTDGNEKFETLIADMKRAEKFIHIQYYIIRNDVLELSENTNAIGNTISKIHHIN